MGRGVGRDRQRRVWLIRERQIQDDGIRGRSADARAGLVYLLCLWGPIWMACFAASLLGETEVNWLVPGYISIVILIGMRANQVFARRRSTEMDVRIRMVNLAFRQSSPSTIPSSFTRSSPGIFLSRPEGIPCSFACTSRPPGCAGTRPWPKRCKSEWKPSRRRVNRPLS